MEFRKDFYKYTRLTSLAEQRAKRSERLGNARAEERMKLLLNRRGSVINEVDDSSKKALLPAPPPKKKSRAEMLQEWKVQKIKRLEELKKKQKPIFKVGVIQRKATGSPLTNISNIMNNKRILNSKQQKTEVKHNGVVTRARAKTLAPLATPPKPASTQLLRAVKNKMKPINKHTFVPPKAVAALPTLTIPYSPQITKSSRKAKNVQPKTEPGSSKKCRSPLNFNISEPQSSSKGKPMTPLNFNVSLVTKQNTKVNEDLKEESMNEKLKKVEVSSTSDEMVQLEDQMKNVSIPVNSENKVSSTEYVPIHYSPYVTMTRGSAKKSQRMSKRSLSMDVNKQIEKEENEFMCRIFSFRKFVECETDRLLNRCSEWEKFKDDKPNLSEDVKGEINSIIGKTKLLTSDKFKQFKDLIEKCNQKDPMIKVDDLQGFQDWVSLEVDKVDDVFNKLEEGKKNDFASMQSKPKPVKKLTVKKENKAPAKQVIGKSNIRAHIMAAKAAKLSRQNAMDLSPLRNLPTWAEAASPSKKTPKRNESLIKSVLTSETKKKTGLDSPRIAKFVRQSSGWEICTATQMAKSLTPEKLSETKSMLTSSSSSSADTSLINLKSTPGKGILKSTPSQKDVSSKKHPILSSKRSVVFKFSSSPKALFNTPDVTANRISEKYFAPPEETDDSECDTPIKMKDRTPSTVKRRSRIAATPVRKSARLANK